MIDTTYFEKDYKALENIQQVRYPREYVPLTATTVQYNGRDYLMMASNNYLGFTHNNAVKEAALKAIEAYGTGSGGARLTSGSHPLFSKLEQELAHFKETESAIIFNTGYMANVGTISALMGKNDIIFSDELNHASIIDGCRLSGATIIRYAHTDMKDLEEKLRCYSGGFLRLIVTDGVFSMDGDIAPLDEIVRLGEKYHALVMVDDAHATGVIGHGKGTAHHFGVETKVDIQLGTLSKSLGSVGGFVCAKEMLVKYLINHSRSYIFSTALSPADIGAALAAVELVEKKPQYVKQLMSNTAYMCEGLIQLGIPSTADTPIFPIIVHENDKALQFSKTLEEKGIILSAIRPPTVPVNQSRLRLTVTAAHTKEELDYVLTSLNQLL